MNASYSMALVNSVKIALFHRSISRDVLKLDLKDHIIVFLSSGIIATTSDLSIRGIALFAFWSFLKAPCGSIKLYAKKSFALETIFEKGDNLHFHNSYILKEERRRSDMIDSLFKQGIEHKCGEAILEALIQMIGIKEDPTWEKAEDSATQGRILNEALRILRSSSSYLQL